MTKTDLHEMGAGGENSGVEFTRHVTDDHALATHLIAFANLHGGRVLLGVDDDGMRKHNGAEPDLVEEDERLTVRLWKAAPASLP